MAYFFYIYPTSMHITYNEASNVETSGQVTFLLVFNVATSEMKI